MSNFRPAGLSDQSDSDDDFYDRPRRQYYPPSQNEKKRIENRLQDAIINNNINEVEEIIADDLKGDVNMYLDSGRTPLMHASFHAQDKIVKLLLDKGADPDLMSDRVTAIMLACSNSNADNDTIDSIVNHLIEKEAELNFGDNYGQTPLMRAISSGRVAVVQKLMDMKVNIEMRDAQGWTAVFWAVHHNQPEILELLISKGARLLEVDNSNRKIMEIAVTHDYQNIEDILKQHIEEEPVDTTFYYFEHAVSSWHTYYPDIAKCGKPSYSTEITHLLYGMTCEKLNAIIQQSGIDLRTFLMLEEKDMIKLGIDLAFQRERLITGLHSFHKRAWELNTIPTLMSYSDNSSNFTVVDGLTSLGSHLLQVYIIEATLQCAAREFCRSYKYEPKFKLLDSTSEAAIKLYATVKNNKRQLKILRSKLAKISRNNPQPADLLKEKSYRDIARSYMSEVFVVCSLGFIVYHAKNYVTNMLAK